MRVHFDWDKAGGDDPVRLVFSIKSRLYCGSCVHTRNGVPTTNNKSLVTCGLCHRTLRSIKRAAREHYLNDVRRGLR